MAANSMTAKTNKQRQAEWKASQRAKGLKRVPDIWARQEDHDAILGAAMAIISDTTSAKVQRQFDVIRERYAVPPLSNGGEIRVTEKTSLDEHFVFRKNTIGKNQPSVTITKDRIIITNSDGVKFDIFGVLIKKQTEKN